MLTAVPESEKPVMRLVEEMCVQWALLSMSHSAAGCESDVNESTRYFK